jgi:purine-cytosine permease-like protein
LCSLVLLQLLNEVRYIILHLLFVYHKRTQNFSWKSLEDHTEARIIFNWTLITCISSAYVGECDQLRTVPTDGVLCSSC